MTDRIDEFVALLEKVPGVVVTVDRSHDPNGESFIDIGGAGLDAQVNFRASVGFGFYVSADVFGQKPDVLVEDPRDAANRLINTVVNPDISRAEPDPSRPKRLGSWQRAKASLGS